MHELKSLGGLTLADASGTVADVPRRRLALLASLATGGGRGVSRERLVALFWPDNAPESGRHSLDQLLSLTRRQLGDEVFLGSDPIRLNPAVVSSDVATFESAVAAGDLVAAVGRYGGPFLDAFYLNDAGEFERWSEGERERLAQLYRGALRQLAVTDASRGDAAAAVGWWRRLVVSDPLGSQGAIGLMRALVAAGDRPGAMQHARVYEALVRQQLDMAPDPSVTEFVEQLRTAPEPPAPMPVIRQAQSMHPVPPTRAEPEIISIEPAAPPPSVSLRARRRMMPIAGVVLLMAAAIAWVVLRPGAAGDVPAGGIRSVAVLPFAHIGADSSDEWLTDGLTTELIDELQGESRIEVRPRSSSFYYKGASLPSREVGRQLNVEYVVEGSLRRDGTKTRVDAHLVNVKTGFPIWRGVYDNEKSGALVLQEQVARSIADSVLARLIPDRPHALAARRTTRDSAALDLYFQGRYFWGRRTDASLQRAIECFKQALARDSTFALAWAGLADSYSLETNWGNLRPTEAFSLARNAAQRALELDPTLAEVHTSLGIINLFYDWNFPEAKRQFEQAVTLNRDYAPAHQFYALYFEAIGQPEEALREMRNAVRLEPLSVIMATRLGAMLARLGRASEAIAPVERAIQLDSTDANARIDLAIVYSLLGRHDSALAVLPPLGLHLGGFEGGIQVFVQARAGKIAMARRTLAEMEQRSHERYVSGEAFAVAYAALGDPNRAMMELNRAVREHSLTLAFARDNEAYGALRGDSRFKELVSRIAGERR